MNEFRHRYNRLNPVGKHGKLSIANILYAHTREQVQSDRWFKCTGVALYENFYAYLNELHKTGWVYLSISVPFPFNIHSVHVPFASHTHSVSVLYPFANELPVKVSSEHYCKSNYSFQSWWIVAEYLPIRFVAWYTMNTLPLFMAIKKKN